jgi:C1A family cysteine protease
MVMRFTTLGRRKVSVCAAVAIGALLALPPSAASADGASSLEAVRERIERLGLKWRAGETSMNRMSSERAHLRLRSMEDLASGPSLGRFEPFTPRDVSPDAPVVDTAAERFSWADVGGADWSSPVKDQGDCGSCAVFAAVGCTEARFNVSVGDPAFDIDLAEQDLLSCTLGVTCTAGTWDTETLIPTLQDPGITDELCHPYTATTGSCADACATADQRRFKIVSGGWLASVGTMLDVATEADIKDALVSGPMIASFVVPESFYSYTGGVYEDSPTIAELTSAWHTVLIVGWDDHSDDDDEPSWIVKNSWGPEWGLDGFFEIQRDSATRFGTQATALEVDATNAGPLLCVDTTELDVSLQAGSGAVEDRAVQLSVCDGAGEVTFFADAVNDYPWLTIDPETGSVGGGDAGAPTTVTLSFSEAAYDGTALGAQTERIYFIGPNGQNHVVTATLDITGADADSDADSDADTDADTDADSDADTDADTDADSDSDADADAGSDDGDSANCSCSAVGASTRVGLLAAFTR